MAHTVHQALEEKIAEFGNAKYASRWFHVSEPYLSQIRSGERPMSAKVAALLGYKQDWVKIK